MSDDRRIGECVEAILTNADRSDPVCSPDPIAFISVVAYVLWALVPRDVVLRRKDEISAEQASGHCRPVSCAGMSQSPGAKV